MLLHVHDHRQRTQFVCVSMPRRSRAPERRQSDRQGRAAKGCALGKADRMKCGARKKEGRRTADGPDARSGPLQDSGPNRAHRSPTRVSSLAHTHTHITHMDTAPGRTCGSVGAARRSHRPPCRLPLWQREASRRLHAASSWGGGRRPGATVAPSPRAERGVPAGRLPTGG